MHMSDETTGNVPLNRRQFLRAAGGGVSMLIVPPLPGGGSGEDQLVLQHDRPASRVVAVRSDYALTGTSAHVPALTVMLKESLLGLTGCSEPNQAWRNILSTDDVIGLKFNQSGQQVLGTTEPLADVLIGSLLEAGFKPDQIVCIEAPQETAARHGTALPVEGYESKPATFDSGADELALALSQVTALIDIPFAKHHNIAGITGCLKNLSHALVKHPARYHANACAPYIADIVGLSPIRSKLRLCLVDALRIVFDEGPTPSSSNTHNAGTLLASYDPVAADTISLMLLNDARREHHLLPIARSAEHIPSLADAHRKGLGIALAHGIDLLKRTV